MSIEKWSRPPFRRNEFVVTLASCRSQEEMAHCWVGATQDEQTGQWTLDDHHGLAPVMFSVVSLVHSYKRPLREGEKHEDEMEPVPPTDAAHIAAGWEFVSAHEHIHHYVADDEIGAIREDLIHSVFSLTMALYSGDRTEQIDGLIETVMAEGASQIARWNERLSSKN